MFGKYMCSSGIIASAIAVFAFGPFVSSARADLLIGDTVTAKWTSVVPGSAVNLQLFSTSISGVGAGQITWQTQSSTNNDAPSTFSTFCIDIPDEIYGNTEYTYAVEALQNAPQDSAYVDGGSGPMGVAKAQQMQIVYDDYLTAGGSSNSDNDAAYQLALWAILYDNYTTIAPTVNSSTENFYETGGFDTTAISDANNWLSNALSRYSTVTSTDLVALVATNPNDTGPQDQIYVVFNPVPVDLTSAPLPQTAATGLALLCGVGGFAAIRRRFVRQA